MERVMHSGVYRIHCVEIQKSYYGSSNNIYRRFNEHRSLLRRKKHANSGLQKYFNEFGIEKINFEILELCEINALEECEKRYLENDKEKLNIWLFPFSPSKSTASVNEKMKSRPRPNTRHLHTEETKKKLSKIVKQHWSKYKHPCKGKKRTEEEKKLISLKTREAMQKLRDRR
jgi:group I intron endonuclease